MNSPARQAALYKKSDAPNSRRKWARVQAMVEDERGMSTVEYVILLAVIVVGAVGLWNQIGSDVKAKLSEASAEVKTIGDAP
jgi:Flp pilus assembly pilin Flp